MKPFITPKILRFATNVTAFIALLFTSVTLHAAEPASMNEEQKTLYAIGLSIARSLSVFDLTAAEFGYVKQGLTDAVSGKKGDIELTSYNGKIQEMARTRRRLLGDKQSSAGRDFLKKAVTEKGAIKTSSGMVYTILVEGKGEYPKSTDVVKVNYRGTLIDGREFDSSYKRGIPLEFKLDNVIKCWVEGVRKMKPGGKARLVCPPNLAYGDNGAGELILPGATLAFEVELLEIKPAAEVKLDSSKSARPAATVKK
ncbi:MAG: FKBP-type peptidyl-prolyl cis-trans isomerase [Desulfuromonadaceae bacterium]|nr:FKBP-type peptidyl-prolyl cis-trans isomerase [Desulfuromonadaceae bacterium]